MFQNGVLVFEPEAISAQDGDRLNASLIFSLSGGMYWEESARISFQTLCCALYARNGKPNGTKKKKKHKSKIFGRDLIIFSCLRKFRDPEHLRTSLNTGIHLDELSIHSLIPFSELSEHFAIDNDGSIRSISPNPPQRATFFVTVSNSSFSPSVFSWFIEQLQDVRSFIQFHIQFKAKYAPFLHVFRFFSMK